jgi:hypothetical protein
MSRVEGRSDRGNRPHRRQPYRRLQHGRAAERVPDQNGRRLELAFHERRGRDQVLDIRREGGAREVTLAFAQSREVEAHDREPLLRHGPADVHRRLQILGAREAVRKQRARPHVTVRRQAEPRAELCSVRTREGYPLIRHRVECRFWCSWFSPFMQVMPALAAPAVRSGPVPNGFAAESVPGRTRACRRTRWLQSCAMRTRRRSTCTVDRRNPIARETVGASWHELSHGADHEPGRSSHRRRPDRRTTRRAARRIRSTRAAGRAAACRRHVRQLRLYADQDAGGERAGGACRARGRTPGCTCRAGHDRLCRDHGPQEHNGAPVALSRAEAT